MADDDSDRVNRLVTDNQKLASYTFSQFFFKTPVRLREDLMAELRLALVKAAVGYDETRSRFSTYAVVIIRNAGVEFLRRQAKDGLTSDRWVHKSGSPSRPSCHPMSAFGPRGAPGFDTGVMTCHRANPEESERDRAAAVDIVDRLLSSIECDLTRSVCRMRFLEGRHFRDIGNDYGRCAETIRQICLRQMDRWKRQAALGAIPCVV